MRTIDVVCFSPDGRSLAIAARMDGIKIWDLEQELVLAHLSKGGRSVTSIDYSSSGHLLVFALNDGTVKLWDMTSMTYLLDLPLPQPSSDLIWTTVVISQDERIIAASAKSGHVVTWECEKGTWENPIELRLATCPLEEDSHAAYIAFPTADNGQLCRTADVKVELFELPKSERINESENFPGNLPTLKKLTAWPHRWDVPTSVSWSSDRRWILAGDISGRVECWDEHGSIQFTLYGHSTGMFSLVIIDHVGMENRLPSVIAVHGNPGNIFATAVSDCVRIWQYDVISR